MDEDQKLHELPSKFNYDLRLFSSLLVPSMFSGAMSILLSLFTVGTITILTNYQGSIFQQDIIRSQNIQSETLSDDYGYINEELEQNVIIDRAPVMVFWMFVGTLVYFTVTGLASAISGARSLEQELGYVHVRSKELLKSIYYKSLIRLIVLAVWFVYIMMFFKILLPYILATAHVGAGSITTFTGLGYLLLSVSVMTLSLHTHVIMLRLLLLRPRVLSQETSF